VTEGQRRIRFGINGARGPDWPATCDLVQAFEGMGFDSYLLPDHPFVTGTATWTSLAAPAEATTTIRLGTLVSCVYFWNPVVLARAVADVDRISGGRVVLGLGSGDMEHKFHQLDLSYPQLQSGRPPWRRLSSSFALCSQARRLTTRGSTCASTGRA
jgi:alkanesulfonate monooxygenase SsuD/methylene tetrahydromethanopterin reductase-like flavin-dependent oxidoreductase (luciferase family)